MKRKTSSSPPTTNNNSIIGSTTCSHSGILLSSNNEVNVVVDLSTTPSPPKARKMISLKSLMASIHCSPIRKPCTSSNSINIVDNNDNQILLSPNCKHSSDDTINNNQCNNNVVVESLTPPKATLPSSFGNEEIDRKLMPSPRKKILLRAGVKSSPKRLNSNNICLGSSNSNSSSSSSISKTSCVSVDNSCSTPSYDYHKSSPSSSSAMAIMETPPLPMDQVIGFLFVYDSHDSLKLSTYCQAIPLRKGRSVVSRKNFNDIIINDNTNKKLPLHDHWICIDRPYISRVHAVIEISDGEFVFIEDLSSSNNTHIVEKTEKKKLNVHIKSNKLYQLRDCNYILFGKSICQYREKSEMDERSITNAIQVYFNNNNNNTVVQTIVNNTPLKKKTPLGGLLMASRLRDESPFNSIQRRATTIPDTPEFNRPSKLPSIRDRFVPPTVYADRKTPILAFETPKRIQEIIKSQPTTIENPILSIEQTPPSKCTTTVVKVAPSSSTSSCCFITPSNSNTEIIPDTPNNGSLNVKNTSPKSSSSSENKLNLTDVDLSSLSLPDEIYEDFNNNEEEKHQVNEEMQDESILLEDELEDDLIFSDNSFIVDEDDEEEHERRNFEDDEESFIAPKKKQKIKKSEHQSPHILFTGLVPTDDNIKAIERLGGVLVEEPEAELLASRLTHLITDKLKRFVPVFHSFIIVIL